MKISNIQQNTPEWIKMRRNYIGASDASAIMGVSPYRTAYECWLDKVGGVTQDDSYAMAFGRTNEPAARAEYELMTGVKMAPAVVLHELVPFMMASLDGLSLCRSMSVEIKCANVTDHQLAKEGKVPSKYYPQLQHQLACTGHDFMHYFSFHHGQCVLVEVERDEQFITKLIDEERKFWNMVQSLTPPAMVDNDRPFITDKEFNNLGAQYAQISSAILEMERVREKLKYRLLELCDQRNCYGDHLSISRVVSKGRVDYSTIEELKNVDLNKYRGINTVSFRINITTKTDGKNGKN